MDNLRNEINGNRLRQYVWHSARREIIDFL